MLMMVGILDEIEGKSHSIKIIIILFFKLFICLPFENPYACQGQAFRYAPALLPFHAVIVEGVEPVVLC